MNLLRMHSPDEDATILAGSEDKKMAKKSEAKPDEQELSSVALAKALKDQQKNSVSRADYEKLKEENRQLVDQIINGGDAGNGQKTSPEEAEVDIEALRKKLYGPKSEELTNLQVADLTLQLRDAVIKKEGKDPFLPYGAHINPTEHDEARAQAVADVLRECVNEANGDSGVFTALLQSKINNDSPALTAHLKKVGAIR